MTKYEPIQGTEKQLKVEVFYDKGGMNYFNAKVEPRGYWLSMRQVEVELSQGGSIRVEKFGMFSGAKVFLMEVKRQSEKAYLEACKLAEAKMEELKEHVLGKAE